MKTEKTTNEIISILAESGIKLPETTYFLIKNQIDYLQAESFHAGVETGMEKMNKIVTEIFKQ